MIYIRKSRDVYTKEKGTKPFMTPSKGMTPALNVPNMMMWQKQQTPID